MPRALGVAARALRLHLPSLWQQLPYVHVRIFFISNRPKPGRSASTAGAPGAMGAGVDTTDGHAGSRQPRACSKASEPAARARKQLTNVLFPVVRVWFARVLAHSSHVWPNERYLGAYRKSNRETLPFPYPLECTGRHTVGKGRRLLHPLRTPLEQETSAPGQRAVLKIWAYPHTKRKMMALRGRRWGILPQTSGLRRGRLARTATQQQGELKHFRTHEKE